MNSDSKRVVLVDDHSLFAESLEMALRLEGYDAQRLALVRPDGSQSSLQTEITRLQPRVLLLDLDLGVQGDGTRLIGPLTEAGIAVVVITGSTDRARWGAAVSQGARRVVSKLAPLHEVVGTVRRIHEGLPVMSRAERDELLEHFRRERALQQDARERLNRLTRREAEVLGCLMAGKQVSDIAKDRFVSESTIRTQVKSVLAKLQVSSQLTAVGLAHRAGWQPPRPDDGQLAAPGRGPRLRRA